MTKALFNRHKEKQESGLAVDTGEPTPKNELTRKEGRVESHKSQEQERSCARVE